MRILLLILPVLFMSDSTKVDTLRWEDSMRVQQIESVQQLSVEQKSLSEKMDSLLRWIELNPDSVKKIKEKMK